MEIKTQNIVLRQDKTCKHVIRYATVEENVAVDNVYISKAVPGILAAQTITLSVTVGGAAPAPVKDDAALLAALK
jgi:hypothetical protein